MGSIKDETKKTKINSNVDKAMDTARQSGNDDVINQKDERHPKNLKCPKLCCHGVLMQSISVAVYKPWLYQCTACAKKFHLH